MSAWDTLKTYIDDNIRSGLPNGIRPEEEHNPVLQLIVDTFGEDYTYMGVATTSTTLLTMITTGTTLLVMLELIQTF